jgi:hypothetical protein
MAAGSRKYFDKTNHLRRHFKRRHLLILDKSCCVAFPASRQQLPAASEFTRRGWWPHLHSLAEPAIGCGRALLERRGQQNFSRMGFLQWQGGYQFLFLARISRQKFKVSRIASVINMYGMVLRRREHCWAMRQGYHWIKESLM